MSKGDGKVREEKRSLLPKKLSEAPVSRIQGADECVRQVKTLPIWAIEAMEEDLAT